MTVKVDNKTSHAGETATETRGDERVGQRVDGDDAKMNANNPTPAPPVDAPPDGTADSPGTQSEPAPAVPYLEPLVLQTDLQTSGKEIYHVAELLQFHDKHFVENVYIAILGRKPCDAERARALTELRGGRAGKVEIIERLLAAQEEEQGASPARRVRIEGLPSPVVRRLSRMPVLGYVLRLGRALLRLPVLIQHQQQFEIYALAQQRLIADYVNQTLQQRIPDYVNHSLQQRIPDYINQSLQQIIAEQTKQADAVSQTRQVLEAVAMFSDALLDLSNSHANLQAQTQTQVEQIEAALTNLTQAITTQQQLSDAQQEFLTQEQRVIVETQKVVLEELREELRELSRRQESVRAELDAEVRRLLSLPDAGGARPPHSSDQA